MSDQDGRPPPAPPPSRRRRRARALALLVLGTLVVSAGAAEAVLRALGRRPRAESVNGFFFLTDPRLGWRNRPDATYDNDLFGTTVRTGPRGERLGVRPPAGRGEPTVLFVGDSTTFCAEVQDDETAPSEVAKLFPSGLDASVVNAGVRAYGTVQAARMAEEWLARAEVAAASSAGHGAGGPSNVRVVVYTYADNDYVENVDPIVYLPAWAPVGRIVAGTVEEVDPPLPAHGWGGLVADEWRPSAARRACDSLERRSALAAGLARLLSPRRPDGPPIRSLETGAFGPVPPALWEKAVRWAHEQDAGRVIEATLRRLRASCEARGARLLVTRFTTLDDGSGPTRLGTREKFLAAVTASGVELVGVAPAFSGSEATVYMARGRDGSFDAHWGPRGTRAYARALAPRVIELLQDRR